jgi:hypothetical protein
MGVLLAAIEDRGWVAVVCPASGRAGRMNSSTRPRSPPEAVAPDVTLFRNIASKISEEHAKGGLEEVAKGT